MSDLQLQKQQEQQQMQVQEPRFSDYKSVDEYIDKISAVGYETRGEEFVLYHENKQQMEEADLVLNNDKALIQYYEKNAPEKLAGLRSKSFFNIPGKKAEKRALRKEYYRSKDIYNREQDLVAEYRRTRDVADKTDEQIRRSMMEEEAGTISDYIKTYEGYSELDSQKLLEKTAVMNPVKRNIYYKHISKLKEKAVENRVKLPMFQEFRLFRDSGFLTNRDDFNAVEYNFLYTCKDNEKLPYLKESLEAMGYYKIVDADLYGSDTEETQSYQTKVAKLYNPSADYKTYRVARKSSQLRDKCQMPDIIFKEIEEGRFTAGNFERAVSEFMRPVEYRTEGDKQVPKTEQDRLNLEFNTRWTESYISDNEADWEFRFKEMEKFIDTEFDKRRAEMEKIAETVNMETMTVQIDDNMYMDNIVDYRQESGKILILSGIQEQATRTNVYKSKYFSGLSKERQDELSQKGDILTAYSSLLKFLYMKNHIEIEGGSICGQDSAQAAMMLPLLANAIKEGLAKLK